MALQIYILIALMAILVREASPCLPNQLVKKDPFYWPSFNCFAYYNDGEELLRRANEICIEEIKKETRNLRRLYQISDFKGCVLLELKAISVTLTDEKTNKNLFPPKKSFDQNHGFLEVATKILHKQHENRMERVVRTRKLYIRQFVKGFFDTCGPEFEKVKRQPSSEWDTFYDCVDEYFECGVASFLNG